jgi:hypothetical protein
VLTMSVSRSSQQNRMRIRLLNRFHAVCQEGYGTVSRLFNNVPL